MDKRTRTALEASIRHWEDNVNAVEPDDVSTAGGDCALCWKFACNIWEEPCARCPVYLATGKRACFETPYVAADRALSRWYINGDRETFRAAAQAEVDFLKSLLPKEG